MHDNVEIRHAFYACRSVDIKMRKTDVNTEVERSMFRDWQALPFLRDVLG